MGEGKGEEKREGESSVGKGKEEERSSVGEGTGEEGRER